MSEKQIKYYYERIEKLLNRANKETYGFAPQEIKNILRSYEELQNQNQELNKHLEVPEPCNLKTLEDYKSYYEDTTKEQILADTYIDYCAYVNLAHRYAELKKQVEEKNKHQIFIDTQDMEERYAEGLYQDYLEEENKKYKNQQKDFIEYLESYLKLFDNKDIYEEGSYDTIEEILSKYKEIIG